MKMPFVICGATGNIGSKIAGALLDAGEPVRVVGRERARLGPLAARGAEPWPGDIGDASFLEKAFAGAGDAFVLIPPKPDADDFRAYQSGIADSIAWAARRSRIPRLVVLSSIGAHLSGGNGPIAGLHELEARLDRFEGAVVFLRPGYFMENHLWAVPVIRSLGYNGSPVRGDVPFPMVATKDIAAAASRLLLEKTVAGHAVRYVLGPRDLTLSEATRIMGGAIGKPDLRYVQLPEGEARKAMIGAGMSANVADVMLEMERGFNAGLIVPTERRTPENSTPTTLEEFAQAVFARAYRAAA